MAAKTSRPARRTTTTARTGPVAVPLADGIEPLRFTTPTEPVEEERVTAFYIDDTPYTVPAVVSPSLALRYVKLARTGGSEVAMGELMEAMLGAEAYDALAGFSHLTEQNIVDLMGLVRKLAMGALEAPKEGSRSA